MHFTARKQSVSYPDSIQETLGLSQAALVSKDNSIPKAYINYLFFDKENNFKNGGYRQVSEAALGSFEELALDFVPEEEGTMMIYTANQTAEDLDVYMDDMMVMHTEGPIIRVDDYYPFGLTFNSSERSGYLTNRYLYNGKELQPDLDLDWYDYGARMYMPEIGRWGVIDPLADKYHPISPYVYVSNNPINYFDPDGRKIVDADGNVITYEVGDDGNLIWSDNVTEDVRRIGNALYQTEKGLEMLNQARDSDINISFAISSGSKPGGDESRGTTTYSINGFTEDSDGNYSIESASITIWEGTIKKYMEESNSDYFKILRAAELLIDDQALAATAGHEIIHATDQGNINISIKSFDSSIPLSERENYAKEREQLPHKVQATIAIQAYKKMGKLAGIIK